MATAVRLGQDGLVINQPPLLHLNNLLVSETGINHISNQIWARSIGEASPILISIFQKVEEASPISTGLDFCRDIIPLEISHPYLFPISYLERSA